MTVVNDKLYIIGGSYGQQYYKDFYIIDTGFILDLFLFFS